jgi:hypothetical protein
MTFGLPAFRLCKEAPHRDSKLANACNTCISGATRQACRLAAQKAFNQQYCVAANIVQHALSVALEAFSTKVCQEGEACLPGLSIQQTAGTSLVAIMNFSCPRAPHRQHCWVPLYDFTSYEEAAECAEVLFAIVLRAFRYRASIMSGMADHT